MPLARSLGLAGLTFYGVGIILGAGIYSVSAWRRGKPERRYGSASPAAGFSSRCSPRSRMRSSRPRIRKRVPSSRTCAEHGRAGPVSRWWSGCSSRSRGPRPQRRWPSRFAGYLGELVAVPALVAAWVLLAVVTSIDVIGVQQSGWVNTVFTLVEGGGLLLFTGLGATTESFGAAFAAMPELGVLSGAALVFFSFLGFENIANLAEEAEHPGRDLPRAIFLSLGIATTLYVLVAVASVALVPVDELADARAPLADAARPWSPAIAGALGGIALFATANTALVSILVASRVVFGIARDGELPRSWAKVSAGRKSPWVATLVVAAVAVALVPFGNVGVVASLSSFASLLAFATVNVALVVLRYREPQHSRPFRVRGSIGRFRSCRRWAPW